ncbi:MAG: glycosyltransferase family 4 protein, partial [Candidatus Omnitrophica bacterium]|nr:glycosyltransferase family 4 protein [Candidatus Omnitrophota bacterium]
MPIEIKPKRNNKKLDSVIVKNISPEKAQLLHQIEEKDFNNITAEAEQIICENFPPHIEKHYQLNPLRIALLSWESLHSISVGGIGAHVTQLAAALERQGHDVHVFTRKGWDCHDQYDCIHGVHYHRVSYHGHSDLIEDVNNMCQSFVSSVFHTEDYMGAHFDIVHAHDWLTSNAMVWIKEGKGRKSIMTVHATEYGRCGNNFYGGPSARIRD